MKALRLAPPILCVCNAKVVMYDTSQQPMQGRRGASWGGGYTQFVHGRSRMTIAIRPSHPYYAETEHIEFTPTRQTWRAPSSKRREVFGESREE